MNTNLEKQKHPWLSLVTFCAVTVLFAALGSAALFAGASVAFALARPAVDGPSQDANESAEQPALQQQITVQPVDAQSSDDGGAASGQTFAGMITDAHCRAKHRSNSGKTAAECARSCVQNGAQYILVDGEKVYVLEGEPAELEKLAGERVSIVGMLEGSTIKVKAVIPVNPTS